MTLFTAFYIILLAVNANKFKYLEGYIDWIDQTSIKKQLKMMHMTEVMVPDELRGVGGPMYYPQDVLPTASIKKRMGTKEEAPIQYTLGFDFAARTLYINFLPTSRWSDIMINVGFSYQSITLYEEKGGDYKKNQISFKKEIYEKLTDINFNDQLIGDLNEQVGRVESEHTPILNKLTLSGHSLGGDYAQAVALWMHADDDWAPKYIVNLKKRLGFASSAESSGIAIKPPINEDNKHKLLVITTGAPLFIQSGQTLEYFAMDRIFNFIEGHDPAPMYFGGKCMIIGNYYVVDRVDKKIKKEGTLKFLKKAKTVPEVKIRKLIDGSQIAHEGYEWLTKHLKEGSSFFKISSDVTSPVGMSAVIPAGIYMFTKYHNSYWDSLCIWKSNMGPTNPAVTEESPAEKSKKKTIKDRWVHPKKRAEPGVIPPLAGEYPPLPPVGEYPPPPKYPYKGVSVHESATSAADEPPPRLPDAYGHCYIPPVEDKDCDILYYYQLSLRPLLKKPPPPPVCVALLHTLSLQEEESSAKKKKEKESSLPSHKAHSLFGDVASNDIDNPLRGKIQEALEEASAEEIDENTYNLWEDEDFMEHQKLQKQGIENGYVNEYFPLKRERYRNVGGKSFEIAYNDFVYKEQEYSLLILIDVIIIALGMCVCGIIGFGICMIAAFLFQDFYHTIRKTKFMPIANYY
eukprot:195035_1